MTIYPAELNDAGALSGIFFAHLAADPHYISHGEMQMGVGEGSFKDGALHAAVAPDGREKWMKYITAHIEDDSFAEVWKAVGEDGRILGFCVADIEEDGDVPFGMVCDVLVVPEARGTGAGGKLLSTAIAWLRSRGIKDIYLESGKDNHSAHAFFRKRGFHHISEIFKLDNDFPGLLPE